MLMIVVLAVLLLMMTLSVDLSLGILVSVVCSGAMKCDAILSGPTSMAEFVVSVGMVLTSDSSSGKPYGSTMLMSLNGIYVRWILTKGMPVGPVVGLVSSVGVLVVYWCMLVTAVLILSMSLRY